MKYNFNPSRIAKRGAHRYLAAAAGTALAVGMSAPAMAQQDDATTPTDVAENAAVDEQGIVVVAQGREQRLVEVPLAVSAVSAETLENTGANDIRQLNQVAPSLLVSSTGSEANGSARIRGVGTVGDNPGLESSVAVFIDGVYRSRSGIGLNELGEIERVEVLRGPQGTLFGRNASAGLINVISKSPEFQFGANGEVTYGNYDYVRASGSITGPISSTIAARLDAVYVNRDGFYNDVNNGGTINDRDRYFVRGQLLFEPNDDLTVRLIGDYSDRNEICCGAVYLDQAAVPQIGTLLDPTQNNIVQVLLDLGQNPAAFSDPYSRNVYITPGRSYAGSTTDGGISMQIDYDLGGAELTSITAYRDYQSFQGSDTDYGQADILYRSPDGSGRSFKTFSQELRLQGEAFGGRLDWLVGGYFANEKLESVDNLRFGNDYGRFANCRIISGGGLAGLYSPGSEGCVAQGINNPAGIGRNTILFATGGNTDIVNGFDLLDGLNDLGSTGETYTQDSTNFAIFTHNIIELTPQVNLTLGARYTSENKDFSASFSNDNTVCPQLQGSLLDDLSSANPTTRALAGALIGLGCQGNSTAELNGVSITDERSEDEFTGTAVLSYEPTDDLLFYGSFSHGYKAGGFNLDRSALKSPILPFSLSGGAQSLASSLQFDAETVDAYELGAKLDLRNATITLAAFRQDFSNFQLNTFNGTVFIVQNINGCNTSLGGADRDTDATTGTCAQDDVGWGVRSQGIEMETNLRPSPDVNVNLGITYADTRYRDNLVGSDTGIPLDPALRLLPGDNLSNAPEWTATASFGWTPELGNSGLSGLFYIDTRVTDDYNTGSDLFPQKEQDSYVLVNGRIGIRGPDRRWSIEGWVQNLLNTNYAQVAFNSPFQAGSAANFPAANYPGGGQIFSSYLSEPRTYGITLRGRF